MSTGSSDALVNAAVKAFVYTYPLVAIEVTRRQATNVPAPDGRGSAPMNQFAHLSFLPDASFTDVVRPNVDTLYSSLFYDVSTEPLVIGVPDMGDRYHLLPILDMWTNVQASPGTRTLGVIGGYEFAITGPDWDGALPEGVREYRMPTDSGWIIGRIQIDGRDDLPAAAALQQKITAVPLHAYGTPYTPPHNDDLHDDWVRGQEVAAYIRSLTPQQYRDLYKSSLSHDQALPGDAALLDELAVLSDAGHEVWEAAWPVALAQIEVDLGGEASNGWTTSRTGMGTYGTDYARRAVVAHGGLGANLPEDAVYPTTRVDADGAPLTAGRDYVWHLEAGQLPPVGAFWSLTLYNDKGFFVANPINRYALRGEHLQPDPDGSVDIWIQRDSPGAEREANWLPAPESGDFNLMLRLYWPDAPALDGAWQPPPVTVSRTAPRG